MIALAMLLTQPASPCTASIAASHSQVRPGETLDAVVTLKPDEGWHVYWINPGDSGMAPSVKFKLPAGVKVSEAAFPVPGLLKDEAGTTFIYEKPLDLVFHITVPADFTAKTLKLEAKANWLVCKSSCLPGTADVEMEIEVGTASAPSAAAEKVKAAVASIPEMAPKDSVVVTTKGKGIQIQWKGGTPRSWMEPAFFSADIPSGTYFVTAFANFGGVVDETNDQKTAD